jgi:hypothetical protein
MDCAMCDRNYSLRNLGLQHHPKNVRCKVAIVVCNM